MANFFERKLVLEDGTEYLGFGFGGNKDSVCEVVFDTSMVGYQEVVSDPSYTYQMVVMTYPLIGNYGIVEDDFELVYNTNSFAGALEELFYYAHKYHPTAKIGYITPIDHVGLTEEERYDEVAERICQKWKVPVFDLFDGTDAEGRRYFADIIGGVHYSCSLYNEGYDAITPYMINCFSYY